MTRGAKKGDNRFKGYIEEKEQYREQEIFEIVSSLSQQNLRFQSVSACAIHVAERFNSQQKKDNLKHKAINKSTILRNSKYRKVIDEYFNQHSKSISNNTKDAEILTLGIENDDLKNEVKRLTLFIENNNLLSSKSLPPIVAPQASNTKDMSKSLDACHKIILSLIEDADGLFSFDGDKIINDTKIVDNEITNSKIISDSGILKSLLYKGL
jgi:hypothetical protein